MNGVKFFPFPKPKSKLERCKAWIKACGRKNFTINNVTRNTYVCSKHFHNGQPSDCYPDPFSADLSEKLQVQLMQPKRLPPKQRTQLPKKKRKLNHDREGHSSLSEDNQLQIDLTAEVEVSIIC